MKLRQYLLLAFLMIHTCSYCQVYVFIVCGNRGQNQVKSHGEWKLIKTQSTINDFDEIKTSGEECYLGLMHASGRSVVIRKPGTYNAVDLLKKVSTGPTYVASKYADFVYSKMTMVSNSSASRQTRNLSDEKIRVFLPNSGEIFNNYQTIRWTVVPGQNSYKITLYNILNDVVAEYVSPKPMLEINFDDPGLKDLKAILITVEPEGDARYRSETYGIQKIGQEKYSKISDSFEKLKADVGDDSPLNNLIFASFFEDQQLLLDAASYYYQAMENSPGVSDLEKMYQDFLMRNGMN